MIGIDVVEIDKLRDIIDRYPSKIGSIFTFNEIECCRDKRAKRFSAIFAAKEAVLKSLNTGWERGRDLLDIEIVLKKNNQFGVNLSDKLLEKAGREKISEFKGSYSFSGNLAIAQVFALK